MCQSGRCDNTKIEVAMLKKIAIYLAHVALWAMLVVVVVWAGRLSKSHRDSVLVSGTDIEVKGGGSNPLISSEDINIWLKEQGVHPDGCILSKVDIASIERIVASHSAVAKVNAYLGYDGKVKIDIRQREPIARLRISGYDMYLTTDGYVLPAKDCHAAHVKVITGDYTPLFDSRYAGCVATIVQDSIASIERFVAQLEEAKLPHFKRHIENNRALREVKRSAPKRSVFDSKEKHAILEKDFKERLSDATERHSIARRMINEDIAAIERAQEEALNTKRVLVRQAEEFDAMVAMIRHIMADGFLDADIAQIVATGDKRSSLQLAIIPRSANVTVDLGTTEDLERKLATLRRFYDKGLSRIGWDKYSKISLRYDGQVVCR